MLKKVICFIAILGMAGVANAAIDWDANNDNDGGDGWDFNNGLNWDDNVNPSGGEAYNIGRRDYAPYTPRANWNIHITANIDPGTGTVYAWPDYVPTLTVDSGVQVVSAAGGLTWNEEGSFTLKTGSTYDMKYGQFALENGQFYTTIEDDALLYCSTLRHNNGAHIDVSGTLRAYTVSRISAEGTYYLKVHNGGLFQVDSGVPTGAWGDDGLVTVYVCGTVKLIGDHTAPSDYLTKVQAGEAGDWDVWQEGGYTYIHLVPEPATALFLLAGLPLLRRRHA